MALPIVAVVGRPNVGKSTLVNRIAQTSDAIVHEMRGVTRDRSYHQADWNGREFIMIDTGGIETGSEDDFQASITQQAITAAREADIIIVLVDGKTGIMTADEEVARLLPRTAAPVLLVVNKMDTPNVEDAIHEFWALGLGQPYGVSATHGHGTGDLLDALVLALPPEASPEDEGNMIDVAIIGKPNAGKSSLLNKMSRSERAIVSEVAGTTRDTLDTVVGRGDREYRLIDTAGLRRKANIDASVEYYGFVRAMRAIDRAEIALLVIDSTTGVTDQDQRVARFAAERGCGLILVLNKWDLMDDEEKREALLDQVETKLGFIKYAPMVRLSALTGKRVERLYTMIDTVHEAYSQSITTSRLNRLLTEMRDFGHTVSKGNMTLRVNYVTQTRVKPPGFTFFANHPRLADDNFKRYVENRMRTAFDLTGTPITLKFRQKD
ncbi:MAG: ribosome biogenesis GTPase Der [Actinomycetota bacterium]|jgi:ribosome-associated GTPase EngA|nr:ribosome biogenesis GTPase Der [Actinomycetota bacterium]